MKIKNKKIVPLSAGFTVISTKDSSMVALVTGATHPLSNIKVTTKVAKVYYDIDGSIMIGITMDIENLSNQNYQISTSNCTWFSIEKDDKSYTSRFCRLPLIDDGKNTSTQPDTITIKPSSQITEENKSTEIIVYFSINSIPAEIFSQNQAKYFNIALNNYVVGGLNVTEWIY